MAKRTRKGAIARTRTTKRTQTTARKRRTKSSAGDRFQQLVDVMSRLRGPGGCPWDRVQTIATLRPFVLEETYEVLDAIDREDYDDLRGEIGDLIFEGVFLAQIAADERRFRVDDSLEDVTTKLVRRHPHVFGDAKNIETPGQVLEQWESIKGREQSEAGRERSVLKSMPTALPALLGAHEIGNRVAAVGFDWASSKDVVSKIREEVSELEQALSNEGASRIEEEMGDLLFAIANLARKVGVEPESALRKANQKFSERFRKLERVFASEGRSVHGATLEEMEAVWQ
jgi:MazG family protein